MNNLNNCPPLFYHFTSSFFGFGCSVVVVSLSESYQYLTSTFLHYALLCPAMTVLLEAFWQRYDIYKWPQTLCQKASQIYSATVQVHYNAHTTDFLFHIFTSHCPKKVQQYAYRLLLEGGKRKLKSNGILGKISKKTHELKFSNGVELALYLDYDHK